RQCTPNCQRRGPTRCRPGPIRRHSSAGRLGLSAKGPASRRHSVRRFKTVLLALGLGCVLAAPARADVTPNGLFTDHMVLQRGMKVPVWGTASPGEKVTVQFRGQEVTATTGQDGKWMVELKKLEAGGPFEMTISSPNRKINLKDVLVGEVWVCSGQSNMEQALNDTNGAKEAIARADNPRLRLFTVRRFSAKAPQRDLPAGKEPRTWQKCTTVTVER